MKLLSKGEKTHKLSVLALWWDGWVSPCDSGERLQPSHDPQMDEHLRKWMAAGMDGWLKTARFQSKMCATWNGPKETFTKMKEKIIACQTDWEKQVKTTQN